MAEDWDLYAIVRSCTSSAVNTCSSNTNTNTNTDIPVENGNSENYLDCLASLTFDDDDDPFSFPDLAQPKNNGLQELQDSYKPFLTSTTSGQGNILLPSIYDFGEFSGQNQSQFAPLQQQHQHQQQLQQQQPPPSPPQPPSTKSPFSLHFNNMQQQLQHAHLPQQQQLHQQNSQRPENSSPPVLTLRTTTHLPASRTRKKKNHLKRHVMQVTAENLCNDAWAWRKYGQKPIKGSPYPRNYYRCSSSKGCAARKQVERSNTDPTMFIVSYTGDHTHPRPTHRNSLAGSTRNKFATLQKPAIAEKESDEPEKAPCSSPLSATSLSPTTPLSASMDHEVAAAANENMVIPEDGADVEGHTRTESHGGDDDDVFDDDDDDILIPNMTLNEDLFKGIQELGSAGEGAFGGAASSSSTTGGLGRSPDFADNFSSWVIGSSAAAAGGSG